MPAPPPVPVHVDSESGHWSVDGVPMILVPQHMLINNLTAAEDRLGTPGSAGLIRPAGYRSAQQWCTQQRRYHGLAPDTVVEHYLEQLGRRGWGRFRIEQGDPAEGPLHVTLHHSALAHRTLTGGHGACYMFAAWLEGAFDFAAEEAGRDERFEFLEVHCRANGAEHCAFRGTPAVPGRSASSPLQASDDRR